MAQPPGTARYYPYNGLGTWTTEGYATASFSPSAVGVNQVYWFGMTVAFSGSNKFGVWNPQTDTGDELDIQFMNGTTHYVSASVVSGSWDLYTPDSIYPVMNIKFDVQSPGFNTYTINFNNPETWLVAETFTGTGLVGMDYVMKALPAGLGYSIPVYVLCFCTRYENPPGEAALELTCGKIMLNSSGAEPQLMMAPMSVEENAGVLTSVRESEWWQKVVSLIFGGGYPAPLRPESPPAEPPPVEPPPSPEQPTDNGGSVDPVQPPSSVVITNRKSFDIPVGVAYETNDLPGMVLPNGFIPGMNKLVFEDTNDDGNYENLVLGADLVNLTGGTVVTPIVGYPIYPEKMHYFVDDLIFEISLDGQFNPSSANFVACGLLFIRQPWGDVKLPDGNTITDDFIYNKFIQYYHISLNIPYSNTVQSYYFNYGVDGSASQYFLDDIGKNRTSKIIISDIFDNGFYNLQTSHGTYRRLVLEDIDDDGIYDTVVDTSGNEMSGYTKDPNTLVNKCDSISGTPIIWPNKLELSDSILFFHVDNNELKNGQNFFGALVYDKLTREYSCRKIPRSRIIGLDPIEPPPTDNGGVDPVVPPIEPPPTDPVTPPTDGGSATGGSNDPVIPPSTDPGMDLVNSIIASGKVGAIYIADSGYNRMYQLTQAQLSSPMSVLGVSGIGPNLIQTNQGTYWYGVLEDRDNDGFFETIIYDTDQSGMGGSAERYPRELVGLYVLQAPPGIRVAKPNLISFMEMNISMHSIIGVADQYLAIIKTPEGYIVSEVPSSMFTTTPTV